MTENNTFPQLRRRKVATGSPLVKIVVSSQACLNITRRSNFPISFGVIQVDFLQLFWCTKLDKLILSVFLSGCENILFIEDLHQRNTSFALKTEKKSSIIKGLNGLKTNRMEFKPWLYRSKFFSKLLECHLHVHLYYYYDVSHNNIRRWYLSLIQVRNR